MIALCATMLALHASPAPVKATEAPAVSSAQASAPNVYEF